VRTSVQRDLARPEAEIGQALADLFEELVFVGRSDRGRERNDQAVGAAASVRTQLGDLHRGAELGRVAQLALADRASVGIAHRHEPVGDFLAAYAVRDLLADLRRALGEQFDVLGRIELA
jgi:hypothetical protein